MTTTSLVHRAMRWRHESRGPRRVAARYMSWRHASPRQHRRDGFRLAIMGRHGVARILTFDRAFDAVEGVTRIG